MTSLKNLLREMKNLLREIPNGRLEQEYTKT